MVWPRQVDADPFHTSNVADFLTIKVGYYGGPYEVKKIYSQSDLEALPRVEQAYTFIDAMPAVVLDSAQGVKLTNLLADAGIDMNSVQGFNFYCTDVKENKYNSITKPFLVDTVRYYYPNLPSHWDFDTQASIPGAVYGAVQVPAMLTLWDNWKRFAVEPDFSVQDISTRYRLLFGQTDTTSRNASMSAKWIHAIEVTLGGTPPAGIELDQANIQLKVGSTLQINATITPPLPSTDKRIIWRSDNSKAVTVNREGKISVVGEGKAIISATTINGITAYVVVNSNEPAAMESLVISDGATGSVNQASGERTEEKTVDANGQQALLIEKANATQVDQAILNAQTGGDQPWRVYEMSADAAPFVPQVSDTRINLVATLVALLCFMSGAGKKYLEYAKEKTS